MFVSSASVSNTMPLSTAKDSGAQEIFVHYSAIDGEGYRNLYEGDRVEFELVDRGKGPQAQRVVSRRGY